MNSSDRLQAMGNMGADEMTLCAESESALKMPRGLIWLASKSPLLTDTGGKQDQALFPIPLDNCQL